MLLLVLTLGQCNYQNATFTGSVTNLFSTPCLDRLLLRAGAWDQILVHRLVTGHHLLIEFSAGQWKKLERLGFFVPLGTTGP